MGNPADIHPTDKKTVGERLAVIALNQTYGQRKIAFRGPVYQSAELRQNRLLVKFKSSGKLVTRDGDPLVKGFEIAGPDGRFHGVTGKLEGRQVSLPITASTKPTSLRYAWSDNPQEANLAGADGLPAEPFRIAEFRE